MNLDKEIDAVNKKLSLVYKERSELIKKAYKELISLAFHVNESYYYIVGYGEKENFRVMVIYDSNVNVIEIPIKQVAQWAEYKIEKDEFVSLLQETQEYQLNTITTEDK